MDLIRLFVNKDFNIQFAVNPWFVILVLIGILIYLRVRRHILTENYEIDETELGIGLPIDVDHDVIVEVYNSWHEFFKITRELIKEIPASKIRKNESTRNLVKVAIEVLNIGIRPHLTKWQAKFRKWYEFASQANENAGLSPQEIQKKFPNYKALIEDMQSVNRNLIKYKDMLNKIMMGK